MFDVITNGWSYISKDWQRAPIKFRVEPPIDRERIFDVFKIAAQRFRAGIEGPPGKIYADGVNRGNELAKYLLREDESFLSYDQRMIGEYGHADYLVYAFDLTPYDSAFRDAVHALRSSIRAGAYQEDAWGPIVAEMFMGRYQTTSGGFIRRIALRFTTYCTAKNYQSMARENLGRNNRTNTSPAGRAHGRG